LSALPRKAVAFLTLFTVRRKCDAGNFAACGQRQGLLALDLGSIFEKLLHQKTFNLEKYIPVNFYQIIPKRQ
jgi:hypothetical protein